MYRALPASRRLVHPANLSKSSKLRVVRRFATSPESTPVAGSAPSPPLPPKKKRYFFRRLLLYSTGFIAVFYAGSPIIAFNNDRYRDFFYESAPFGEAILEYAEDRGWDSALSTTIFSSGKESVQKAKNAVSNSLNSGVASNAMEKADNARKAVIDKASAMKSTASTIYQDSKDKVQEVKGKVVPKVEKSAKAVKDKSVDASVVIKDNAKDAASLVSDKSKEIAVDPKQAVIQFSDGVAILVRQAEAALAGKSIDKQPETIASSSQSSTPAPELPSAAELEEDPHIYTAALPLGFEPPPGFSTPKPKSSAPAPTAGVEAETKSDILPLVAPAVAELAVSEPVLAQLASTIDELASFLNSNPSVAGQARGVLETAKVDLTELAGRFEAAKTQEREKLEATLDEQAREYTLKLLELEMESQDKLDGQEQEFKQFFEQERRKFVHAYREKLDNELRTQSELINERLKEEVIAQGIEMQRRWIRDIKVRVEQERGGRLAKLDDLAAHLKRLERVTLDNATYLDENLRLHALWSALRALSAAVDAPVRTPFREELRVLRHVAAARSDPIIASVLDSVEASDVPDIGVEPLPALTTWFTSSVAPQVTKVALVPEENAGLLSHLASHLISKFRFQRHGLVEGSDALSVLARAEHYMNEKDLDSAARELNQLKGTSKELLDDWLAAARRRLEVLQAIEIVQAQATLASLLVV